MKSYVTYSLPLTSCHSDVTTFEIMHLLNEQYQVVIGHARGQIAACLGGGGMKYQPDLVNKKFFYLEPKNRSR